MYVGINICIHIHIYIYIYSYTYTFLASLSFFNFSSTLLACSITTLHIASAASTSLPSLCIRQHTSAYVSIRHYTSLPPHLPRSRLPAYVSIRQHTPAYAITHRFRRVYLAPLSRLVAAAARL